MLTSMSNGTSALNAFQKAINVESNNTANANTTAFKSDFVSFSDMMYSKSVGMGTYMNDPLKNFTQGSLLPTESNYDFAIAGEGFFTIQDPTNPDNLYYTRTGQFRNSIDNLLTTADGMQVLGVKPTVTGDLITSEYSENITTSIIDTGTSTYSLNTYTTDYGYSSKVIENLTSDLNSQLSTISSYDELTATDEEKAFYDGFIAAKTAQTDPEVTDKTIMLNYLIDNYEVTEIVDDGTLTPAEIATQTAAQETKAALMANYEKYKEQIESNETIASGNGYKSTSSMIDDIDESIYLYEKAVKALAINPIEGTTPTKSQSTISFPITEVADDTYTVEILVNGVKIQQQYEESIENTLNTFADKISDLVGVSATVDTTTGELVVKALNAGERLNISQVKLNDSTLAVQNQYFDADTGEEMIYYAAGSGQKLIDSLYKDLETSLAKVGADVATNKSEIADLVSGGALNFEPIVLDLNALGMNSVLYEKLLNGDLDAIAAYPGIESDDGNIYLTDGDARFLIGKLAPVTFSDTTQLSPQGDNLYTKGENAGQPIYLAGSAEVHGKYLENSNVDLSKELVNLITFQKAYEANSKSITTSDELLQTALALKK